MANVAFQKVSFEPNDAIREILISKTEMGFKSPYGIVEVFFQSEEELLGFDASVIAHLEGFATAHLRQNHRLNIVFFDPKKDPYRAVDLAVAAIASRYKISLK